MFLLLRYCSFLCFSVQKLSYTQTASLRECLSRLPCHEGVEPCVVIKQDSEDYCSTCSNLGSTLTSLHFLHQETGLKDYSKIDQFCLYYAMSNTGWRRLIGSPMLQIIFHKRATKYRSLLRKMTCKDKGSYESSSLCSIVALLEAVCDRIF